MFEKIKVLVVDDSAFMRKVISDMVNEQLDMMVVDTARDGEDALRKVSSLSPDVITLDVEMPKMNGIQALNEIKKISRCEVIMLSSLTAKGSEITIEALRLGAFDFIQKPSGSISLDIAKVKDELVEKIRYAKAHYKKKLTPQPVAQPVKRIEPPPKVEVQRPMVQRNQNSRVDAILLGASTGGPRVLYDVITKLPTSLNVPVLVVQHMPAGFTKAFAERMDKSSLMRVREARDGEQILANTVYVAPGGYHMLVDNGRIKLDTSPQIHGVRPAVDKLFFSAVDYFKGNVISCIFTGMGKDGAEGVREAKKKGGYVISQSEATCTVYGMPKAAYETGCVDIVLPDDKVVEEIIKVARRA